MLSQEEYINNGAQNCPRCKSIDIEQTGHIVIADSTVSVMIFCTHCGFKYWNAYGLQQYVMDDESPDRVLLLMKDNQVETIVGSVPVMAINLDRLTTFECPVCENELQDTICNNCHLNWNDYYSKRDDFIATLITMQSQSGVE